MNQSALQTHLDNLFYAAHNATPRAQHLCFWEGDLQILPSKHTLDLHPILKTFTFHDMRHGLNYNQWEETINLAFNFLKENEPCQK